MALTEQSCAEQSGSRASGGCGAGCPPPQPHHRLLLLLLSLTVRPQVRKGAQGHIPGVAQERCSWRVLHALRRILRGRQRSRHGAVLQRKESQDRLDSGSKSPASRPRAAGYLRRRRPEESQPEPRCAPLAGKCGILPEPGACVDFPLLWSLLIYPSYRKVTFSEVLAHLLYSF